MPPAFTLDLAERRLAPGEETSLLVTFAPSSAGEKAWDLRLRTNDPAARWVDVPVTGTGVAPWVRVDPVQLDLGAVLAGSRQEATVRVENPGGRAVALRLRPGSNVARCSDGPDPAAFCYGVDAARLDGQGRLVLAPGASEPITVAFEPAAAGIRADGTLVVEACPARECETRISIQGVGVERSLRCRPSELDFGPVNPGASRFVRTTCSNEANLSVTLGSWAIEGDPSRAFSVGTSGPAVLNPGEVLDIEVAFSPTDLGDASALLRVEADTVVGPEPVVIPLAGNGGGPDVAMVPDELDFGRVSTQAPARRSFLITNTGFAPLTISEIQVDVDGTGAFTALDAVANVLQPGESMVVTIEFLPPRVGPIASAVRISTNDADQPTTTLTLLGEGVDLPPCNFTIVPEELDFGRVGRTQTLRRAVAIENRGMATCLLTASRLLGGSDPGFSIVSADAHSREIAPGAAEILEIEFSPSRSGLHEGGLEFSISHPTRAFNTVRLTGVGSDAELRIVPSQVDFGEVMPGCTARPKTVDVHNATSTSIRIDRIGAVGWPTPPKTAS